MIGCWKKRTTRFIAATFFSNLNSWDEAFPNLSQFCCISVQLRSRALRIIPQSEVHYLDPTDKNTDKNTDKANIERLETT